MIPYYQWTTIQIGPIHIQVWGMFVALGILTGIWIIWKRAARFDSEPEQLLDLALYTIVGGLVFARVFHIVFYEPAFYFASPIEIFKIWNGGLSSFGGFFGGAMGFVWYARNKQLAREKIFSFLDQLSFGLLFGWIVGRLGCASIHDHLGRLSDSFLAVKFPNGVRLEMALLEIIFLLPLAFTFFLVRKKKLFAGLYLAAFLAYYGVRRFALDFFRATDIAHADTRYLGLTPGQYFGILVSAIGAVVFWKNFGKKRDHAGV